MLRPQGPVREQSCPFCGTMLPAGALYCESCGTDLSRVAATFSTGVKPVTQLPKTRKVRLRKYAKPVAAAAAALVMVVGLSGVPAVSARVPVLASVYTHTIGWGKGLLGKTAASTVPTPGILVFVRSAPSSAQVQVNDQDVGTTPLSIELQPGTYRVRISREGFPTATRTIDVQDIPVTVEVSLMGALPQDEGPVQRTPPRAQPAPPPQPVKPRPLLSVGTRAPSLSLKDRIGVIFSPQLTGSRKTALLFVWRLDEDSQQAIRELDARVRRASNRFNGVVVIMTSDRVRVRSFLLGFQMKVPLVFGTSEVTRLYSLTPNVNALYLISERGTIEREQSGSVWPAAFIQ